MKQIKIIIERSKDAFWAYAENIEGITGVGETALEAKQSIMACIELQKELGNFANSINSNYELIFQFDTESLLQYYNGIFTNAAFERITGINQAQISHYATGLKKPRVSQAKKIEAALHKLGAELLSVQL